MSDFAPHATVAWPNCLANLDLDRLLRDWAFVPGRPLVRRVAGTDGRDVLQMRVDMGLLQLEAVGRPDGERPHGFPTYYDYLVSAAFEEGPQFELNDERRVEIDREFYQYYHRRICWLALHEYARAAADAEHTLRLMDFTRPTRPTAQWAVMHEQYRPFVMFHQVQSHGADQAAGERPGGGGGRSSAQGSTRSPSCSPQHDAEEHFDEDLFVVKLREMQESIKSQFSLGPVAGRATGRGGRRGAVRAGGEAARQAGSRAGRGLIGFATKARRHEGEEFVTENACQTAKWEI